VETEDVVMWLEMTAPQMVDYLKQFEPDQVHAFFLNDPLLSEIGKEEKCKMWIRGLLREIKAEPVGA